MQRPDVEGLLPQWGPRLLSTSPAGDQARASRLRELQRGTHLLPATSARDGPWGGRNSSRQAPRQVNLSTSQPRTHTSPCPEGAPGPRGRPERLGGRGEARLGLPRARARGLELRPAPNAPRSPGPPRSQGARILQTCPGPRGAAGEGKGPACPPAASGRRPDRPASPAAACSPPGAPPPRPPEGRYLGAPAPRSLPAAVGASLRLPPPTSASAEGEGRGGGAQAPALPAAPAARRNRSPRSPCAPQRSAAAGGSGRPRLPADAAPHPPHPRRRPGRGPLPQDPGSRRSEGAKASPLGGQVWDGGREPRSVCPPWGLSSAPISWGSPRSDPPPRVTPPLLSRRCSTWPERVRHNDLADRWEPRRTPHGSLRAECGALSVLLACTLGFVRLQETGDFMTSMLRKVTGACHLEVNFELQGERMCGENTTLCVCFIPIQSYIF